ncbi:uracil-DNA glycosylase family protein [Demequina capsici]|uniref:Uracil-DNA glycosylase family protein n=1 Tax=Demequina capsici TaxID=3075620 RepID=A0AA96JCD5_9MICO|nr:uracil-DNA glycosylase family protein [Demequina sp. OYTSA14]WNM23534.1 uracil-DNA glycosylase family protein [Demequina sp. OYTSA14]
MAEELIGYQGVELWMGVEYLTLRDVIPEKPRAVIVGLNPSPVSVAAGHYYQGQVGQRQLRRLASAGLFDLPEGVRQFEAVALAAGVGFTDIVKRPTVGEKDLVAGELEHGRCLLGEKLGALSVPLVICVFRQPVEALLGRKAAGGPGVQEERTAWGAQVYRMPGPYDAAEKANAVMGELRELLGV